MGKVKSGGRTEAFSTKAKMMRKKTKFKKVSIPYGRGKEQHFVLCFYYIT